MTHALEAAVGVRHEDLSLLFTKDVTAWSPNLMATSVTDLESALEDRNEALSNITLVITGLDVVDNKAYAEWVVEAEHSGTLVLDDIRAEATGRRLQLGGVTVAEFRGHQIQTFRSYFDSTALLEQMID
jgi:hypothetical protein